MTTKTMARSAVVCALACASLGIASASASAAGAVHLTPAGLAIDLGPIPAGQEGVKVVGNCPAAYFTDDMQIVFASGNAVMYRDGNGANVEGQAELYDGTTGTGYTGHTHLWFGQNVNPNNSGIPGVGNQQQWFAQTLSFDGSGPDGTSLTISASFGGGLSASGNESGWTHVKVTCS
jgi:hypothetical protein